MNNLPEIRDIHLPDGVPVFPLAYGWWVILAAIIIGAATIKFVFWLLRTSKKNYALKQLRQIDTDLPLEAAIQISQLLRRICNIRYKEANSLYGKEWIDFLEKHSSRQLSAEAGKLLMLAPFMDSNKDSYHKNAAEELKEFSKSFIGASL